MNTLCMVQFYLLPPPPPAPRNPGDKSNLLGLGVGNCLKRSPGGRGWGKSKITSCCSCEVHHFLVDTMAPDRVEKTAYFQEKSLEFVAEW